MSDFDSTSNETMVSLSLDCMETGSASAVWCSVCGKKFGNYRLFCERMTHVCAAFNWSVPLSEPPK